MCICLSYSKTKRRGRRWGGGPALPFSGMQVGCEVGLLAFLGCWSGLRGCGCVDEALGALFAAWSSWVVWPSGGFTEFEVVLGFN